MIQPCLIINAIITYTQLVKHLIMAHEYFTFSTQTKKSRYLLIKTE